MTDIKDEKKQYVKENGDISDNTGNDSDKASEESKKRKDSKGRKQKKKLTPKQKTRRALKRLLIKIAVIGAIVAMLLIFIGGVAVCHDNNMFPSIKDGDLAIIYKLGDYYNGDIVIYEEEGKNKFGRVIGIAGDTIEFNDDGTYLLNGTVPYETIYFATRPEDNSDITFPYTLSEGEIFVFNDMRDDTDDSRVFGGITEVKGKVVLVVRRRGF